MGVGRLAPSPTGAQHLGNARTFLLAYWSARANGSRLILRIEDIDSPRVKPWAAQQAIDDLRWLGIDWDEGPDIGGPHAPYVQTHRTELYQAALQRLIQHDRVFPCTCSRQDIQDSGSAPHFEHEGPIYPGTCASWLPGDALPLAGTFCWRFRAGLDPVTFVDQVCGVQRCVPANQIGAFPVTQKNGSASYQLAVVVDDALMDVTEVVRGDDLLPSTFRQLELFAALGHQAPQYAHVPLVRGRDGHRLAKRHGDTRLAILRQSGVSSERIVSWARESAGLTIQSTEVRRIRGEASALEADPRPFDWSHLSRQDVVIDGFSQ